jgi:hypothetical protein
MKPLNFPYPDEWPGAVAAYLLDKQEARLGAVAREALGIDGMCNADWWRLVFILWRLGWRYRIGDGALVWSPGAAGNQ